jgi:hypothetical protein
MGIVEFLKRQIEQLQSRQDTPLGSYDLKLAIEYLSYVQGKGAA